ncbi:choice-of-anchor Q domain-containing protein [Solwaraspora sp. WMMD791]|uniref:choice-of-anchor Q domain-containing protein n=1 Tax=Solwaraspora sp. WMMD791 TaxID=3016086 RepID=UPI00249A35F3|nr:choice-of-anchor Q domain-containing protein [Solwaraspora sp. WMMD791]WFE27958.1 choice-of-anchor Q domain-containing protein [Solwaraspora sp. WMMD791]
MRLFAGRMLAAVVTAVCAMTATATAASATSPTQVWVTITGVDVGTCPQVSPCRTVSYAMRQLAIDGIVRIGPGRFQENVVVSGARWISIIGSGTLATVLDGRAAGRVIEHPGLGGQLSLSDLAVTNGLATSDRYSDPSGGGIRSDGVLSLTRVWVAFNAATHRGGGIDSTGEITLVDSVVTVNSARTGGGGISTHKASIRRSAITENRQLGTGGFGGGGILAWPGQLTIDDSTVSGNTAEGSYGSAILATGGPVLLTHATVAGNRGRPALVSFNNALGMQASVFAGNAGGSCVLIGVVDPEHPGLEFTVSDDGTCGRPVPREQMGLLPLAQQGMTLSHALSEGSVLRNAIAVEHPLCDGVDQHGTPRRGPGVVFCDIGAYQSVPGTPDDVVAPSIDRVASVVPVVARD